MLSVQTSGLKRAAAPGPVQVIAVTGGKGGVGKTSVAVNLATALGSTGKRVMLLDGDLGLANVDVFLGLSPRHTMAQVPASARSRRSSSNRSTA
jgi:flagellar biosynthesis protein FlhG